MPSQRRVKVFGLVVLLVVLTTIYMTSAARQTQQSEFYQRTAAALQHKEEVDAAAAKAAQDAADAKIPPDQDVGKRLKEAEAQAKKAADAKGRKMAQEVMGDGVLGDATKGDGDGGKSVAGRVMMKDGKDDTPGVAKIGGNIEKERKDGEEPETEEEHELEVELNAILRKGPIIIFSKTYCPYSRKAKHILLETYNITPAPYVVELNTHPLGAALQEVLAKRTKRKTVPNILINGVSVGGGDDIESLHLSGELESTVKKMGGTRITEVKLADPESEKVEIKREGTKRKSRI